MWPVPLLLAALVGGLGASVVVHGTGTIGRKRRRDIAVLEAIGMTRRQQFSTAAVVGVWLVSVGAAVGVVAGIIAGRVMWRRLSDEISVPAPWLSPWPVCAAVVVATLTISTSAATATMAWHRRHGAAASLRAE